MARFLIILTIFGEFMTVQSSPREGFIRTVLEEVNTNLAHRPPYERVPSFMRDLYNYMAANPRSTLSGYSKEELYSRNPAIKSFRTRNKTANHFKFHIPASTNLHHILGAQLMVKTEHDSVIARFRRRTLNTSEASLSDEYHVFDATELVRKYNGSTQSLKFYIRGRGNATEISQDDVYLVIFEHITAERLHHARRKRDASHFQRSNRHFFNFGAGTGSASNENCRRVDWSLNVDDLSWFWIIQPPTIDMGMCTGSCSVYSSNINITNHGFLRTLYSLQNEADASSVSPMACVPTELSHVMILYFNTNYDIVMRPVPDATVVKCGCA